VAQFHQSVLWPEHRPDLGRRERIVGRIPELEGQIVIPPESKKPATIVLSVGVVLLVALYGLRLGPAPMSPAWNADQAIYMVTARSLSEGKGFRVISYPDAPMETKYPIGYPAFLSLGLHFVSEQTRVGLTVLRASSGVLMIVAAILGYLLMRRYLAPVVAAFAALAVATSPGTFEFAGETMSEALFTVLVVATFLISDKCLFDHRSTPNRWLTALSAGLLAGCAVLVRSIGIAVPLGLLAAFVLLKDYRNLRWAVIGVAAICLPWFAWSLTKHGGTVTSYASENIFSRHIVVANALNLTFSATPSFVLPPIDVPAIRASIPPDFTIL
jgi:hypothetical protein